MHIKDHNSALKSALISFFAEQLPLESLEIQNYAKAK
jgi:hypothetical protein